MCNFLKFIFEEIKHEITEGLMTELIIYYLEKILFFYANHFLRWFLIDSFVFFCHAIPVSFFIEHNRLTYIFLSFSVTMHATDQPTL